MRKGLNSSVKVGVLVMLLVSLCFVFSCKKSEPAPADPGAKTAVKDPGKEAVKPAGDLVPIELELPKPMFVGTPQDTKVENLEKPLGRPRPPFLAPKGTTNVA